MKFQFRIRSKVKIKETIRLFDTIVNHTIYQISSEFDVKLFCEGCRIISIAMHFLFRVPPLFSTLAMPLVK